MFKLVEQAAVFNALLATGESLPVDAGEWCSPRFDVIEAPAVGEFVTKAFNGDYYPEGEIVKITATWQIKTSAGKIFRRHKNSACWKDSNGYGMISGHHDERNPHI